MGCRFTVNSLLIDIHSSNYGYQRFEIVIYIIRISDINKWAELVIYIIRISDINNSN